MQHNIAKQIKIKLSEYALAWAEWLHGGIQASDAEHLLKVYSAQAKQGRKIQRLIAYLQYQRARQREQAEEAFHNTRMPATNTFSLLALSVFEIFHVEQFDQVERGITQLFPSITKNVVFFDNFAFEFETRSGPFHSASTWRLGILYPKTSKRHGGVDVWRVLESLPPEIEYIEVLLHKILPSVFMIKLDIYIQENATEQIIGLHNKKYLPARRFETFNPLRIEYSGGTGTTSEREMQFAVARWLDNIRLKVEISIRPYLSGYFTMTHTQRKVRLPVIEIYALNGVPQDDPKFMEWKRNSIDWLRSLGFNLDYESYGNEKRQFTWVFDSFEEDRLTNFIFIFPELYLSTAANYGHGDRATLQGSSLERATELIAYIAIIRFLNCIEQNISSIRKDIAKIIQGRSKLKIAFKINNSLYRNTMLFNRIMEELDIETDKGYFNLNSIEDLKEIIYDNVRYNANLRDDIKKFLTRKRLIIKQQIEYLDTWFSKYVAARNTEISYAIQIWVIVLTCITIIIGIFAVDWQQTGCRYEGFLSRITTVISWCSHNKL